jgi:hypothetical protein
MEYKIGGITYVQTELTWGQDKAILKLLNRASGKFDGKEQLNVSAKNAFELLSKYDLLGEFWGIVLQPKKSLPYYLHRGKFYLLWIFRIRRGSPRQVDLSAASNSLIKEMFEDFFLLNKMLMKKLAGLNDVLNWIMNTMEKKTDPENPGKMNLSTSGKPKPETKSTMKS